MSGKCRWCGEYFFGNGLIGEITINGNVVERGGPFCGERCSNAWLDRNKAPYEQEAQEQLRNHGEQWRNEQTAEAASDREKLDAGRRQARPAIERWLGHSVRLEDIFPVNAGAYFGEYMHVKDHHAKAVKTRLAAEKKLGWKFSRIWDGIAFHDFLGYIYGHSYIHINGTRDIFYSPNKGFQFPMGWFANDADLSRFQSIVRNFAGDRHIGSIAWENMSEFSIDLDRGFANTICYKRDLENYLRENHSHSQSLEALTWNVARKGWTFTKYEKGAFGKMKNKEYFVPWDELSAFYRVRLEHLRQNHTPDTFNDDFGWSRVLDAKESECAEPGPLQTEFAYTFKCRKNGQQTTQTVKAVSLIAAALSLERAGCKAVECVPVNARSGGAKPAAPVNRSTFDDDEFEDEDDFEDDDDFDDEDDLDFVEQPKQPAKTPEPKKPAFVFCGKCGAKNVPNDAFCGDCGVSLNGKSPATATVARKIESVFCGDCGAKNTHGGSFCDDCGAKLG